MRQSEEKTISGAKFRSLREDIGWDRQRMAKALGCSERQIRLWEDGFNPQRPNGNYSVPLPIARWIVALRDAHQAIPAPKWREPRVPVKK